MTWAFRGGGEPPALSRTALFVLYGRSLLKDKRFKWLKVPRLRKSIMAHPKELKGTIALLGAAAAAVVAVLLGVLYWSWSGTPETPQNAAPVQTAQPSAPPQQPAPGQQAAAKPP